MNTIQTGQTAGGLTGIPGKPVVAAPTAPPAAPDQVTLGQAPPAAPQTVQTPSGVVVTSARDQQGVALQAALPTGALLPAPVVIEGLISGKDSIFEARLVGSNQPLPAGMGADGKVYVQLEPSAPLVVFDPQTLDYGLASPMVAGPNGALQRQMQEIVHADGSRSVIYNEQFRSASQPGEQEHSFTRVDYKAGKLDAAQVTVRGAAAQLARAVSGEPSRPQAMTQGGASQVAAPGGAPRPWPSALSRIPRGRPSPIQETPLSAQAHPDGTITLSGGSLLDHAKQAATSGKLFDSPLMNWWKSRQAEAVRIVPFSAVLASNPGAVFPGLVEALSASSR